MLPTSVEPRAKKKMMSLQPPLVYSFAVLPVLWRSSRMGAAAAKAVKSRAKKVAFMIIE